MKPEKNENILVMMDSHSQSLDNSKLAAAFPTSIFSYFKATTPPPPGPVPGSPSRATLPGCRPSWPGGGTTCWCSSAPATTSPTPPTSSTSPRSPRSTWSSWPRTPWPCSPPSPRWCYSPGPLAWTAPTSPTSPTKATP